jgi:hypothetical protein
MQSAIVSSLLLLPYAAVILNTLLLEFGIGVKACNESAGRESCTFASTPAKRGRSLAIQINLL